MEPNSKKAFLLSAGLHAAVLLLLFCSLDFSAPMPVVSNNDAQVINAIALEDSPILAPPTQAFKKPVKQETQATPTQPVAPQERAQAAAVSEKLAVPQDVKTTHQKIALKKPSKKELSKQLLAELEDE